MKTIVTGILLLVVLFEFATPKHFTSSTKTLYPEIKGDSGYIKKAEALKLLSQAKYDLGYVPEGRDTLDLGLLNIKATDTLGKFYRMENGNYLTCLQDVTHPDRISTLLLIEYSPEGKVTQTEPYWGGMYLCCWDKAYDGFNKHTEGYYSIKTCGTGSAHCSSYTHLFKGFGPQGNGICDYAYTGMCKAGRRSPIACLLTSDMEIKNDTVTLHYKMEHLKERRNGKYKVTESEKFDIKYVEREQGWVALDSTKIYEFPM